MEAGSRIKLPSNDSFEEDALSDVDDEVFIKSARNGFRNGGKDKTLQKPLMAPRKKTEREKNGRSNGTHSMEIHTTSPQGSPILITVLYVTIALGAITGLTGLVIFLAKSHLPTLVSQVGIWRSSKEKAPLPEPCISFVEEVIWDVNLPHAIAQGQKVVTAVDINGDNVDDVVVGFDAGLYGVTPLTSFLCQLYFNATSTVCDGGLVGVNGSSGSVIWSTWLDDAVVSVQCLADLDQDGIKDCVAVGRSRGLWAVSSSDGRLLWGIATDSLQLPCLSESAFHSAQIIEDVSGDKVPDVVVAIKGGRIKCPDYIALINGYSGSVLQLTGTADQRPISIGPILKASGDGGASYIFYITSSAVNSSLYLASLKDVATGRKDLVRTVLSNVSRIDEMLISDITGDGMEELILVIDNSTAGGKDVMALSGTGLQPLWISSVSHAAPLKVQALANLNEDNVPDVVLQITGRMPNATSNSSWIRVLDGSNGHILMNLPPRARRWDVRGESLAVDGPPGADVMVDWIADEDEAGEAFSSSLRTINRLMGFSSRGELPAFVVYSSSPATSSRPAGYLGPETSLHDVLDTLASQDDLRAKFSNFIRHAESERSREDDSRPMTAELEPGVVGYPAQHGIRKHGNRWNAQPRRGGYQPAYDYDEGPLPADLLPPVAVAPDQSASQMSSITSSRRRKPVGWAKTPNLAVEDDDGVYLNPNDYVESGGSGTDYDDNEGDRDYSRYQHKHPSKSWGRRGKRIRRQTVAADQPTESVRFPPLALNSGLGDGSVDLVFGVQWSWSEPEEKEDQMRALSDCVSRRLDQDRMLNEDVLVDYAAECSQSMLLRSKPAASGTEPMKRDGNRADQLVSSAVDHWLRPLARRQHGWVSLKRLRLRCRCSSTVTITAGPPVTTTPASNDQQPSNCPRLRSQRRKVDFSY